MRQTLAKYADCFALSISEVNAVPGAVHKLNIPEGTSFKTKIPQRPMNQVQHEFMNAKVNEMLAAGIMRPIHPRDLRCVAPTVLTNKTHKGGGLSINELKHKVNNQCIAHGLLTVFDLPPPPTNTMAANRIPSPKMESMPGFWQNQQSNADSTSSTRQHQSEAATPIRPSMDTRLRLCRGVLCHRDQRGIATIYLLLRGRTRLYSVCTYAIWHNGRSSRVWCTYSRTILQPHSQRYIWSSL